MIWFLNKSSYNLIKDPPSPSDRILALYLPVLLNPIILIATFLTTFDVADWKPLENLVENDYM